MNKTLLVALALNLSLAACGSDSDSPGSLNVTLSYPAQGAGEQNTSSVRVWVLAPLGEQLTCAQLVAVETEPFAVRDFERLSDSVFNVSTTPAPFAIDGIVSSGRVMVYGEVTDHLGTTILAGCADLPSLGDAALSLITPRTFDCADSATAEGAVCDDGLFCTVGETCSGGTCGGFTARDCSYQEDQCNGSACTEELGCQPVASPEGTNCSDSNGCTQADQCDGSGSCIPGAIDCSGEDRGMCVVGTCNTGLQVCEPIDSDDTFSSADDTCSQFANIAAEDCYRLVPADECNATTGRCNITTLSAPPNLCNNQCIINGICSGTLCVGGTDVAELEEATETTCNDSRDNDCDNLIDCADTDCAASPDCL